MHPWIHRLLKWAVDRAVYSEELIDSNDKVITQRYCPFWRDEYADDKGIHQCRPPWYRPFNILLHCWQNSDEGSMHDHPRWSITILLAGKAIEHNPWGKRELIPGSIVVRSRKAIHRIEIPPEFIGITWSLFIVGRRNHLQNYYKVNSYDREY